MISLISLWAKWHFTKEWPYSEKDPKHTDQEDRHHPDLKWYFMLEVHRMFTGK